MITTLPNSKAENDDSLPDQVRIGIPAYTYALLFSIVAVFISQLIFGDAFTSVILGDDYSVAIAGFDKHAFLKDHEYWRILTGATVHGGILHVALNEYALIVLGRLFEILSNRAHLAIVFLTSCIVGGLFSLYFLPKVTSVGASGGIVGFLGYLTVYAFRRRQFISSEFRKNMIANIGMLVVFGLIFINEIDNFGHLGGLITGAVYGFLQIPSDPTINPREASGGVQVAGLISLGIYIAGCIFSILLITKII
jgi:membrane associated rhomboid family serine protease